MPLLSLSKLHYFCHFMKRFLILILAMVYFAASSGVTVHVHYCMGHFVNASLTASGEEDHECGHCGMKKKKGGNGCCRDEHKIVKNAADHSLVKEINLPVPADFVAIVPVTYVLPVQAYHPGTTAVASFQAHAPPDPVSTPLYLRMRNLRV